MEQSPPRVVFFDVDHTLLRGSSAALAARVMVQRGLIARRHLARAFFYTGMHRLGRAPAETLFREGAAVFRGLSTELVHEIAEETYRRHVRPRLYQEGLRLVAAHVDAGHEVVLLSGGPVGVVRAVASTIGATGVIASEGAIGDDGRYTGEPLLPFCYGAGKVTRAERFLAPRRLRLESCVFYSDSITDLPLLARVGVPRVVNPDRALRRVAGERGWDILDLAR